MSESIYAGSSDTSSVFTSTGTFTSASTIPGLGSLSGKAIKRVGSAVVNQVDAIIIRRRLSQLEANSLDQKDTATDSSDVKSLYSDLLELARIIYSLSIRTRAFRMIMSIVGGMDFQDLAAAIANWPISESYDLLKSMILCFRDPSTTSSYGDDRTRLETYYKAGLDAYKANLRYKTGPTFESDLYIAFLLFLGLTISLSKGPAFSRSMTQLDIPFFLTETHTSSLEFNHPWSIHLLPARLLRQALLEHLDPVDDAMAISQLRGLLSDLKPGPTTAAWTSRSSTHSKISQLRKHFSERNWQTPPNVLLLGPGESGKVSLALCILFTKRGRNESICRPP
ncbi:hypothetical protein BDP27DRAFT_1332472 [Rhodocollybia butyracea]|uniref:Uncharacterized protein n=1 Tax=Rhodocollybia butyracea TaxID=206335 RepID=A0A9P5U2W3_9AGAR|nr:hypothetical protein BDP27DRAFT_1332472 [Rhodocollybia butyracea]